MFRIYGNQLICKIMLWSFPCLLIFRHQIRWIMHISFVVDLVNVPPWETSSQVNFPAASRLQRAGWGGYWIGRGEGVWLQTSKKLNGIWKFNFSILLSFCQWTNIWSGQSGMLFNTLIHLQCNSVGREHLICFWPIKKTLTLYLSWGG